MAHPVVIPDDPRGPNPLKLKKPFRLDNRGLCYVRGELFKAVEMLMDHLDRDMKPWDIEDPKTGKREIYVEDKNILRKMYKLKQIYEKQRELQPNSNNWNFGSVPPQLLEKS